MIFSDLPTMELFSSYDPSHRFQILAQVGFDIFRFFFKLIFFSNSPINIRFVEN